MEGSSKYLQHLNLDYDKDKLLWESKRIIHDLRNEQWVRGYALGDEATRVADGIGEPMFYIQRAGVPVKKHIDGRAKCCVNIVLSDSSNPVIFEGHEFYYTCALLNVGTYEHEVKAADADRIMLRIISLESYDDMALKLRDRQRVLS